MPELDDIMKAFGSLQGNLQTLQAQRVITGANDEVERIRNSENDFQKKNQMLKDIGTRVTGNLLGIGVPVDRIEALTQSFAPKTPQVQTLEQLQAQALQTGDLDAYNKATTAVQKQEEFKMKFQQQKDLSALERAGLTNNNPSKITRAIGPALREADTLNKQTNLQLTGVNKMADLISRYRSGKIIGDNTFLASLTAERAKLQQGLGQLSEHSQQRASMESYIQGLIGIEQKIENKPKDAHIEEFVNQIEAETDAMKESAHKQIDINAEEAIAGWGDSPLAQGALKRKYDAIRSIQTKANGGKWLGFSNTANPAPASVSTPSQSQAPAPASNSTGTSGGSLESILIPLNPGGKR